RRYAERGYRRANEQPQAHVHHGLTARMDVELVRARAASGIQKRIHRQRRCISGRTDDPEIAEPRELLSLTSDGIDRESPRRQTVVQTRTEGAKVAGAEEHDQLVLVSAAVQGIVRPETREAEITPLLRREFVLAVVELGAVVGNVAHALRGDLVDA